MELADDLDGIVAVALFVACDKIGPAVVDDLPQG
jgi:hypothetical protein